MPFEKIAAPNLSDAAAAQIRELIARDVLRPGDQLPGERDLSAQMGVSRTSLRAGLQTLVAEGLLIARHGAGLYVTRDLGRSIGDPVLALIESSEDAVFDYIRFRIMLEGDAAATAAEQGTKAEHGHIDAIHQRMADAFAAGDAAEEMRLDREFHMAIVEASGNVVAIQVARSLQDLLARAVADNHALAFSDRTGRTEMEAQHAAINAAIQSADPLAAREAMRTHLDYFANLIRTRTDANRREALVRKRATWSAAKGTASGA